MNAWDWPQYTTAALIFVSLGISIEKHGKPKTGRENVWTSIVAAAIQVGLLYAGGFWR